MFSSGYETRITAQELASALVAIANREIADEYLLVELVSPNGPTKQVSVRLTGVVELANTSEILHCITPKGKKVDFNTPPPKDRADGFLTAVAFIEDGV